MKESFVTRACLVGAVSGIIILYFLSMMITPVDVTPSGLSQEHLGKKVIMSGTVRDLRQHPSGHVFFELDDGRGSADIVIWEERAEQLKLSGVGLERIRNGISIEIRGDVELYKGSLQVVV